ncbi:MAG TPA: DinB family protein [Thermoanaerobaculia bacterium]|nr:DinB family protein [Thermoanaerobaculia bacterium]
MAKFATLLEEALEAWAYTRAGVIEEVENLSDEDLAYAPRPEARTAAELARHIVESGLLMSGELSRADGDFRRKSYEALLREHGRGAGLASKRTKRELVAALRRSHRDGEAELRKAGELHMLQLIRRFDGVLGTRFAWMQHGISHEEYHRGQLALYARLLGRVPALTQRILGE